MGHCNCYHSCDSEGLRYSDDPVQGDDKRCYDGAHIRGSNNRPVARIAAVAAAAVLETAAAAAAAAGVVVVAAAAVDFLYHHVHLYLHDHHDDEYDEGGHLHRVVAGEDFHSGEGDFRSGEEHFHLVPFVASGQVSAVAHS